MSRFIIVLLTAVTLSGCAAVHHPDRSSSRQTSLYGQPVVEEDEGFATNVNPDASEEGVKDTELYPGTANFINRDAARRRPGSVVSADGEIVLNFEGESIQSVVHTLLGEVLQETFVIGPGVNGEVTFATAKPVSKEQLMPILELLLRWNGATLVYSDGRYHVLPIAEAIPGHLVPRLADDLAVKGFEVRAVPLKFIAPAEMEKILQPYVRQNGIVNVDNARNMIFIAGTREELRNYLQTIEIFDVDWLAGMSVGIFPLKRVDVESITAELTSVFGAEGDTPLAGLFRFVPLERLSSVMVITPNEDYLSKAQEWITRLDRGAAGAGQQLYVYRVKNLEADVLAGYLSQLFGDGSAQPRRSSSGGGVAPGLEQVQIGSTSDVGNTPSSNQTRGGGGSSSVLNTGSGGDIRITSVVETNSLLIQATQSQYESILGAINRIDDEPLQVLIEAQVIEVTLNETLEFGVSWFLSNQNTVAPDSNATEGLEFGRTSGTVGFGADSPFSSVINKISGNGKHLVRATISALDRVTDVRTLSAPSLLVRNNAEASINVGDQIPVNSTSISTGIDNNVVSRAQYVSTGVTLTVTPRINPGGLVYLDINQEVSNPGDPAVEGGNPPISSKSINSQVAVQSGNTIILAGLITEFSSEGRNGLPYVNRVPVFGSLFGKRSKNDRRTETLVMITPTVIENSRKLQAISDDFRSKFSKVRPLKISELQGETRAEN